MQEDEGKHVHEDMVEEIERESFKIKIKWLVH